MVSTAIMDASDVITLNAFQQPDFIHLHLDSVNNTLPFFEIRKQLKGVYNVTPHNYDQHPRANRMVFLANFLKSMVLPLVDHSKDVSGFVNIQLDDIPASSSKQSLVFAKEMTDKYNILIPDFMHLTNLHMGAIANEPAPTAKLPRVYFLGTYNSALPKAEMDKSLDPFRTVLKSFESICVPQLRFVPSSQVVTPHHNIFDLPADSDPLSKIIKTGFTNEEILRHKYVMIPEGSQDISYRTILRSKSMLWRLEQPRENKWVTFTDQFMIQDTHYVSLTDIERDLPNRFNFFQSNLNHVNMILNNAQWFCKYYLKPVVPMMYFKNLFENSQRI